MTFAYATVVDNTRAALTEEPDKAAVTFATESRQVEGLKSIATIRQFSLTADEPEQLGGADTGPNPVELVLAALGTCQEITYRLYADSLGIPLDGVSVRVEGDLDLRGFFAVDDDVRPGYQSIRATVEIDSPASPEDLARLKQTVDAHCPVLDILRGATPVETGLVRGGDVLAAA